MRTLVAAPTLFLAASLSVACVDTVVRSGLPAASPSPSYDDRWHSSFLWGTVELAPIEDVNKICPDGWSELRVSTSAGVALLQWVTLGIYTPSTVTLVCASPSGAVVGKPGEEPLPPGPL